MLTLVLFELPGHGPAVSLSSPSRGLFRLSDSLPLPLRHSPWLRYLLNKLTPDHLSLSQSATVALSICAASSPLRPRHPRLSRSSSLLLSSSPLLSLYPRSSSHHARTLTVLFHFCPPTYHLIVCHRYPVPLSFAYLSPSISICPISTASCIPTPSIPDLPPPFPRWTLSKPGCFSSPVSSNPVSTRHDNLPVWFLSWITT